MKVEKTTNPETCKFFSKGSKKYITLKIGKKKESSSNFEKILRDEIKKLKERD